MIFEPSLNQGILIRRYKRFFADIDFGGNSITAHVPNTGSLKSALFPGSKCYFSKSNDEKRKLKYTLEILENQDGTKIGINTRNSNIIMNEKLTHIFAEPLSSVYKNHAAFSYWKSFSSFKPEIKITDDSRIDFVLYKELADLEDFQRNSTKSITTNPLHFIEVKNVTFANGALALFPDSPTLRGQKHITELEKLIDQGHSCELVFTIQRNDTKYFAPATDIDPKYAKLLSAAVQKGLKVSPLVARVTPNEISLSEELIPFVLDQS